ncbi:hypothetical protein VP01_11326g1 [Puccinia sorghi]|uniref:Uncharacterized protein n=1 Tax=Puccinia sorghi TaxID=27349 RepID=A0A0L6VS55_9BASI|nr:hypothetical protein VP01_11326g1 [Puccinia sorghi]
MEGDGPTGAFVLANYYQAIKDLKKKEEASSRENAFHPMYHKMIKKLEEYQEEALKCEPLGMCHASNFWLSFEPNAAQKHALFDQTSTYPF